MTRQQSFKRLVRARMGRTGESYTTARAQLLAAVEGPALDAGGAPLVCNDERIRERTGRGWEEWFALLDDWSAESLGHTAVAKRVAELLGIHQLAWDAQAVTTSFERARGLRAVGERAGGFTATTSKTIAVAAEHVFSAIADPSVRAQWLPGGALRERTSTPPRSIRFDWGDGTTRVNVTIDAKTDAAGSAKATVTVEHSRLADTADIEAKKAYWRAALVELAATAVRATTPAG